MAVFLAALCFSAADPIVLSNGAIRVEVDAEVFAVRYVGRPGGLNFVEPLFVPPSEREGTGWVDPGGLTVNLYPLEERDAALLRGPAEVIERTDWSVALLGPESAAQRLRILKEIRIEPEAPVAHYAVTVISTDEQPKRLAVQNAARVPGNTTVSIRRDQGVFQALNGEEALMPLVSETADRWRVQLRTPSAEKRVVFGAFVNEVAHENRDGLWVRRLNNAPEEVHTVPLEATFIGLVDEASASRAAIVQGPWNEVTASSPAVLRETWTLELR